MLNKTPEQLELERLELEQNELTEQLVQAELNLENIRTDVLRFSSRYYAEVGKYYAELDQLEAKLARLKANQSPENESVQTAAEQAEQRAQATAEELGLVEKAANPPPVISPEVKSAFRQAAKLMHPDRATNDAERERRNTFMSKVNLAYEKADLKAIEQLIQDFGEDPEVIKGDDIGSQMIKAIRRISQIKRRLSELNELLKTETEKEMYLLMCDVAEAEKLGDNPLQALAEALMSQISERKIEIELFATSTVDIN